MSAYTIIVDRLSRVTLFVHFEWGVRFCALRVTKGKGDRGAFSFLSCVFYVASHRQGPSYIPFRSRDVVVNGLARCVLCAQQAASILMYRFERRWILSRSTHTYTHTLIQTKRETLSVLFNVDTLI